MSMSNLARSNSPITTAIDADFLSWVMKPYFDETTYLQSAEISHDMAGTIVGSDFPGNLSGWGKFTIPQSCYIESTGHFNAVEFVMCFNQLGYLVLAHAFKEQLIPGLEHWSQGNFAARQLPDVLILSIKSEFRKMIDASDFRAAIHWKEAKFKLRHLFIKWQIEFSDDRGGLARGEVLTCIRNALPQPEAHEHQQPQSSSPNPA